MLADFGKEATSSICVSPSTPLTSRDSSRAAWRGSVRTIQMRNNSSVISGKTRPRRMWPLKASRPTVRSGREDLRAFEI